MEIGYNNIDKDEDSNHGEVRALSSTKCLCYELFTFTYFIF